MLCVKYRIRCSNGSGKCQKVIVWVALQRVMDVIWYICFFFHWFLFCFRLYSLIATILPRFSRACVCLCVDFKCKFCLLFVCSLWARAQWNQDLFWFVSSQKHKLFFFFFFFVVRFCLLSLTDIVVRMLSIYELRVAAEKTPENEVCGSLKPWTLYHWLRSRTRDQRGNYIFAFNRLTERHTHTARSNVLFLRLFFSAPRILQKNRGYD